MPANDDDDLPGGEATEATQATSKPTQSGTKNSPSQAVTAVSPPARPVTNPAPLEKPKHSRRLLKLAEDYGIPSSVIEEVSSEALLGLVHDMQVQIANEQRTRIGTSIPQTSTPAVTTSTAGVEKPKRLNVEAYKVKYEPDVVELVDLLNSQADLIEELRGKTNKIDDLEKAEQTRTARTVEGHIDDAFDSLGDAHKAPFGEGPMAELADGPEKERRLMIFRAAGIDVTKDTARVIKSKIGIAVKTLLGAAHNAAAPAPAAGGYAAEPKKGPGVAEEWAANTLAVPTNRNGAPELVKPSMSKARAKENEWRRSKGLPVMDVSDDDDSDLPE